MDTNLGDDWFDSFMKYQRRIRGEYMRMQKKYGFEIVNANRSIRAVDADLRARVERVLEKTIGG